LGLEPDTVGGRTDNFGLKGDNRNVQRFRGGLVFKAHRLCVSLNSRLESKKEEEEREQPWGSSGSIWAERQHVLRGVRGAVLALVVRQ